MIVEGLLEKVVKGTLAMDLYMYDPVAGLKGIIAADHPIWTNKRSTWDWGQGVALAGLLAAYKLTGDEEIAKEIKSFVFRHLEEGLPKITVNSTIPYLTLLWMYEETKDERYLARVIHAADYCLNEAVRVPGGLMEHTTLHHKFSQEIWVDTMFVAGLYLMEVSRVTGNPEYAKEAVFQIMGHVRTLYDSEHALFYHGYNGSNKTPISTMHWGRGTSWAAIIMAEVLTRGILTEKDHKEILEIYVGHVDKLVSLQDANGLWHTVLDQPWTYLESSSSAGFCYAIQLGLNQGLISGERYEKTVERTLQALNYYIDHDGRVFGCSAGTGIYTNAEGYNSVPATVIQPWGQGLVLFFLQERLKNQFVMED